VQLFAADVDCGRWGVGRDALKAYYSEPSRAGRLLPLVHLVCGQTIDLIDMDHATGTVYCRAGHEDKGPLGRDGDLLLRRYVKSEGRWCFERRDEQHWYSTDWSERPHGPNFQAWPGKYDGPKHAPRLPQAWPSWQQYWKAQGDEARLAVTDAP
jgi:hypothetical protein